MEQFVAEIKKAALLPVEQANEYHQHRAKFLRAEIQKHGKAMHELTAAELVRINQSVDEKLQ